MRIHARLLGNTSELTLPAVCSMLTPAGRAAGGSDQRGREQQHEDRESLRRSLEVQPRPRVVSRPQAVGPEGLSHQLQLFPGLSPPHVLSRRLFTRL